MPIIADDQTLEPSSGEIVVEATYFKPTLWQAFKLSVIATLNSLPVLLFAFFLLIIQHMLLPKELLPSASVGGGLAVLFPLSFCLLSVACLSVLFQAGWMHLLVERTKKIITLKNTPKQTVVVEATETVEQKVVPAKITVLQHLFAGIGQFGKPMLAYYAFQLLLLIAFILLGAWLINLIGIPAELQNKQLQVTVATWLQHLPTQAEMQHVFQQWDERSIQQISSLSMLFSSSVILFTLFILFTSFLPSIIVTKQVSFKQAFTLQLQLIKQYPIQAVFISSFQVVGGCLLPLSLPSSSSFIVDILLYFGTYLGMMWSQAFPIAYLLLQTNFPKKITTEPEVRALDMTV